MYLENSWSHARQAVALVAVFFGGSLQSLSKVCRDGTQIHINIYMYICIWPMRVLTWAFKSIHEEVVPVSSSCLLAVVFLFVG